MEESFDLSLPKSQLKAIFKNCTDGKFLISKEAINVINNAVVAFILYLSHNSQLTSKKEGKKTIMPQHVMEAFPLMNMNYYQEPLRDFLSKWRASRPSKHVDLTLAERGEITGKINRNAQLKSHGNKTGAQME